MRLIFLGLIMLVLSRSAAPFQAAPSLDARVSILEEDHRSQLVYDASFAREINHRLDQMDAMGSERRALRNQQDSRQDTDLADLLRDQYLLKTLGGFLLVAMSMGATAFYFWNSRKYTEQTEAGHARNLAILATETRLDAIEALGGRLSQQLTMVINLAEPGIKAIFGDLHHPVGHDEADALLDSFERGHLTGTDDLRLRELMEQRSRDENVSLHEQRLAKLMPAVLDAVSQFRDFAADSPAAGTATRSTDETEQRLAERARTHGVFPGSIAIPTQATAFERG